jgi:hypothetical protein
VRDGLQTQIQTTSSQPYKATAQQVSQGAVKTIIILPFILWTGRTGCTQIPNSSSCPKGCRKNLQSDWHQFSATNGKKESFSLNKGRKQ